MMEQFRTTTGKPAKCSGNPFGVFVAEDLILLDPIKDQNIVFLSNEEDVLDRWTQCVKDHLNEDTVTPSDTQDVHFGKENTVNATVGFLH